MSYEQCAEMAKAKAKGWKCFKSLSGVYQCWRGPDDDDYVVYSLKALEAVVRRL